MCDFKNLSVDRQRSAIKAESAYAVTRVHKGGRFHELHSHSWTLQGGCARGPAGAGARPRIWGVVSRATGVGRALGSSGPPERLSDL